MKITHIRRTNYNPKVVKRYSESFKLSILEELSEGRSSKEELKRRYNFGSSTIDTWIKKYNRKDLLNRKITIQMPNEIDQKKQLKNRIAELEKALAQTQLDHLHASSYLEVAAEELGYKDRHEFIKKHEVKPSKKV